MSGDATRRNEDEQTDGREEVNEGRNRSIVGRTSRFAVRFSLRNRRRATNSSAAESEPLSRSNRNAEVEEESRGEGVEVNDGECELWVDEEEVEEEEEEQEEDEREEEEEEEDEDEDEGGIEQELLGWFWGLRRGASRGVGRRSSTPAAEEASAGAMWTDPTAAARFAESRVYCETVTVCSPQEGYMRERKRKKKMEEEEEEEGKEEMKTPGRRMNARLLKLRPGIGGAQAKERDAGQAGGSCSLAESKYLPLPRLNLLQMVLGRECSHGRLGRFSPSDRAHILTSSPSPSTSSSSCSASSSSSLLPLDGPVLIDSMDSRAYISQFSEDGSLFIGGFQDRRIRLYDVESQGALWTLRKDVLARNLRWTVTDTALSPDNRFLIYASISPVVNLVNVGPKGSAVTSLANVTDIHESLDFSERRQGGDTASATHSSFGIWSVQFSSDGSEILAGSNDRCLYVYDVGAEKRSLRIRAHEDDVNSVAFMDGSSSLIVSASDDRMCKVWDRRALSSRKAVGILPGHCEGITHVQPKGDGRHFVTNSKDQSMKLWDTRTMLSQGQVESLPRFRPSSPSWDYRWMDYPGRGKNIRHPHDKSLATYSGGHQVLQTLIRCYFSPQETTGQRFLYSGSHDGSVYIYDLLSTRLVACLSHHGATVRDCSWHPHLPLLLSSSWDGSLAQWESWRGEKRWGGARQQQPRVRVPPHCALGAMNPVDSDSD